MVMRAVKVLMPGGSDMLKIVQVPIPVPRAEEVLIKVHSTAINRADILQRKGLYPPPIGTTDVLGLECSGVVAKGNGWWAEGTPVMGFLRGGGYAEYATVHKGHVLPMPSRMSFVEAAAVAEVWLTAYKCLKYIGKAQAGETVLVHAGASGVGSALIQLGKYYGLKVLSTCGSDAKVKYCQDLGADFVWNYKNGSFVEGFDGRSADLILDCVGKDYFEDNVKIIKKEGRWVVYGFLSGSKIQTDLGQIFGKLVQLNFTSFRSRTDEYREKVVKEFVQENLLEKFGHTFKSCVFKTIRLEDISEGHDLMQNNENSGKIVVKVADF